MMDNLIGIIAKEEPEKLLKSIVEEISQQMKNKLKEDILLFIYEPSRKVLRLIGNTTEKKEINGCKIMTKEEKIEKELSKKSLLKYKINDELKALNTDYIYIYPLISEDKLLGVVGLFKENINIDTLEKTFSSYEIILKMVMENLSIKEIRERVLLIEKITDLIQETLEIEQLYTKYIKTLNDFLHAEKVIYWELHDEKLVFKYGYGIDKNEILKKELCENSLEYEAFKKTDKLIIGRKSFLNYEKIFDIDLKSAMFSTLIVDGEKKGLFGIYNRNISGLRLYKNFDELDFDFFKETVKKMSIGVSRINLYNKIKSENDELKSLKESTENLIELQNNQLDKMNSLHKISQAIRSTYDKNMAIKIMLIGLTSGRGLRFNRALYLEKDNLRGFLVPKLWIGPDNFENVHQVWEEADRRALKYGEISQYLREEAVNLPDTNKLTESVGNKVLAYKGHPVLERVVQKRQIVHVKPNVLKVKGEELEDIYDIIKCEEFLIFPITGRTETKGVVIVDNIVTRNEISDLDSEIIKLFLDSTGLAFEMIENYNELRHKNKTLEEQKNMMDYYRRFKENILQNLVVGIIVVDRQGEIIEWNQKSELMFSKPRENVIGQNISIMKETFGEDIINTIDEVYEKQTNLKYPSYKLNIGEDKKVFDIQFSPLRNPDLGFLEGVIILLDDVTELFSLQKEMEKREKLAAIGEMTSRIAHEIRNPLTVIGGFLKRMNKKIDDPNSVKKYTDIINSELVRLEDIVSEILEYSRGSKLPRFEKINFNDLIDDVLMMYEDFVEQKNIDLKIMKNTDIINMDIDRNRIKQVLINLIKNAIEVVSDEGNIRIKTGVEKQKTAYFEIYNDGEPIPEEVKEKLFMPFFTTKTNGTGLGLPICKKIIEEEHKGKLYLVKSNEDGTVFKFEIPIN
ncbi:ATP-binding protein [Oceanotoga sp. DSM 15011]|uniref:ATP-binding protein n=1 Tax=Oceanotoga sp. DSM 15011 TaxID=2984951 RepID=UPI0021F4A151|nr:ATP-binding protein [Oceanotoga sp. DSM 15011]UYO98892.1 ATP-binding protein [Oceanotoga sp. DSM 15011]